MNEFRYKVRVFLMTLIGTLLGIAPTLGCTGGCGSCFQCAGLGGVMAVLAVLGMARKKKQGGKHYGVVEANH